MATYTRADLRNSVMYELAVLGASEAPTGEDSVLVLDKINFTLELLADDGLIPFDIDAEAIPAAFMTPLTLVIAPTLCNAFGKGGELRAYEAMAAKGMRDLRKLKAKPYLGTVAQANYY